MSLLGRLRLWHQFAAVGLLASGLPLWLTARTFLADGSRILRDHEVIDLADEANLRVADVREDLRAVVRWVAVAARSPDAGDRLGPLLADWQRHRWTPGTPADDMARLRRRYLADALVGVATVRADTGEPTAGRPAAPSAAGRTALAELVERVSRPDACYVSDVHPDADGRLLVAVGRVCQWADTRPVEVLAVVLDLAAYLDARGRVDARHLYLLAGTDGRLLYHPHRRLLGEPLAAAGWDTTGPEPAAALDTTPASLDERLARLTEAGGARLTPRPAVAFASPDGSPFPTLRFRFLKGYLPDGVEFGPRFGPAAVDKLAGLTAVLGGFTDGLRVRIADPGLRSRYLEVAADDPATLAAVRAAVDGWWAGSGGGGRIGWTPPLDCHTFYGQIVPLRIDPADTAEPVRLVVAAADEELTEDIADRFREIVVGRVLPTLAAAVAGTGLLVWALTRSLRGLAAAAESLSARPDPTSPLPGTGEHPPAEAEPPPRLVAGGSLEVTQLTASLTALYERLRQANDTLDARVKVRTAELAEANGKLEAAVEEARTAARAKDAFLANMSHELRNPLHIILGFADELRDVVEETGRPDLSPDLDKIRKAGKHLLQLINDILDLAKIEAGKMDLTLAPVPVRAVLNEVRALVEPLAAVNKNRLLVDAPPGLGRITTDDKRLKQILLNLLSNAFKFTDAGVVTLSARRVVDGPNQWVRLAVRDTGKGLTPAQVGRLFERFYQADDSTTRKQGGTGLGLSICQALAERLGAKPISVTSRPGVGSEFVLLLPADPAAAPSRRSGQLSLPVPVADQSFYVDSTRTVLVIDDDPQVRELMERFLTREGFSVRTAGNAADGLKLARLLRPACVTLDVMMPGTDGWQVLADLKSHAATADIPVVMLTIADDRTRGFALGAADYLTKPIDWPRLATLLRRYQTPGADRPVLVVDDDPECRELVRRQLEGEGWRVSEAADGGAGLAAAAADPPVVVLLDLMMPGVDGFGFLDELPRRLPHPPPVVVLTAKDLTAADHDRLTGRVSSILAKGDLSHLDELLARVRAVAGRPAGGG